MSSMQQQQLLQRKATPMPISRSKSEMTSSASTTASSKQHPATTAVVAANPPTPVAVAPRLNASTVLLAARTAMQKMDFARVEALLGALYDNNTNSGKQEQEEKHPHASTFRTADFWILRAFANEQVC